MVYPRRRTVASVLPRGNPEDPTVDEEGVDGPHYPSPSYLRAVLPSLRFSRLSGNRTVFDLPEVHHARRAPHDFDTLRFVLPGSFGDGRKGQLSVLYASLPFTRRNSRAIQSCTAISALLSSGWRKIFSPARFGSTRTYSVTG